MINIGVAGAPHHFGLLIPASNGIIRAGAAEEFVDRIFRQSRTQRIAEIGQPGRPNAERFADEISAALEIGVEFAASAAAIALVTVGAKAQEIIAAARLIIIADNQGVDILDIGQAAGVARQLGAIGITEILRAGGKSLAGRVAGAIITGVYSATKIRGAKAINI